MIHDLLSLQAYFATYKGQFGIADYCYGNTDDILSRKSKTIRYPCLWVELMDEDVDDNDKSIFAVRLVLQEIAGNSPREQDWQTLNKLRGILKQIRNQMQSDSPTKLVYYSPKSKLLFKERFAGDDELIVACDLRFGGINICS
jgi:hypothetical protein